MIIIINLTVNVIAFDIRTDYFIDIFTASLPDGWIQLLSPDGKVYYQNNITKTTQWERPKLGEAKDDEKSDDMEVNDPWPMKDNYMDWSVDNIADWISYLNDAFIEYGDKCKEHNICGQHFHQLTKQSFWINKISVDDEQHIKALCKAAKYRMEQYQIVKDEVIEEGKDMNIDNEENKNDEADDLSDGKFVYSIDDLVDYLLIYI